MTKIDLLSEMEALIDAAHTLLNTVTLTRGHGPEDEDRHEHEKWAADELEASVKHARAILAKLAVTGQGCGPLGA